MPVNGVSNHSRGNSGVMFQVLLIRLINENWKNIPSAEIVNSLIYKYTKRIIDLFCTFILLIIFIPIYIFDRFFAKII